MEHLKLTKGLSYRGHGITATKAKPDVYTEDKETASALIASGYFTSIATSAPVEDEDPIGDFTDGEEGGASPDSTDGHESGSSSEENKDTTPEDKTAPVSADDTTGSGAYTGKTLEEMTVAELETYATYKNISLKGISLKKDIINKLREELGEEETSGVITYGSPTIVELQQK